MYDSLGVHHWISCIISTNKVLDLGHKWGNGYYPCFSREWEIEELFMYGDLNDIWTFSRKFNGHWNVYKYFFVMQIKVQSVGIFPYNDNDINR
jgi:hypothetical protein